MTLNDVGAGLEAVPDVTHLQRCCDHQQVHQPVSQRPAQNGEPELRVRQDLKLGTLAAGPRRGLLGALGLRRADGVGILGKGQRQQHQHHRTCHRREHQERRRKALKGEDDTGRPRQTGADQTRKHPAEHRQRNRLIPQIAGGAVDGLEPQEPEAAEEYPHQHVAKAEQHEAVQPHGRGRHQPRPHTTEQCRHQRHRLAADPAHERCQGDGRTQHGDKLQAVGQRCQLGVWRDLIARQRRDRNHDGRS